MVSPWLVMMSGGGQEPSLQGVGGGVVVAGEAAAEGGADGAGQDGQGDVEVDVERDGTGEGVDVEGADGLGEALFDVHPAGVSLDELFGAGDAVVGDDDGGGVAAEAGDDRVGGRCRGSWTGWWFRRRLWGRR